jgi:hypothetical protein
MLIRGLCFIAKLMRVLLQSFAYRKQDVLPLISILFKNIPHDFLIAFPLSLSMVCQVGCWSFGLVKILHAKFCCNTMGLW